MFKARNFDKTASPRLVAINLAESTVIFGDGDWWYPYHRHVTQASMNRLLSLLFSSTQFRYTHSTSDGTEVCFEEFKPR